MSSAFFDHLEQYKPEGGLASSADVSDIDDIFSALIGTEASGPDATSPKGARGTAQIMPDTFKQYAVKGENYNNEADRVKAARRKAEDDYAWASGLTDDPDQAKKLTAAAYFGGRGGAMLWAQGKGGSRNDGILDINGYVDRFTSKIGAKVNAAFSPAAPAQANLPDQDPGADMSRWNVGRTDEPMRASDYGNIATAGQVSAQEQSDASPFKTSAVRGWEAMTTGLGLWKDALVGDHESMAGRIKEYSKFDAESPMPSSAAKFNADWRAEEYAKALFNIPGFAMANVEQLANMVPSMVGGIPGAVKGAAVGSGFGPMGTFIGGVLGFGAGSAPGTVAVEGGMHVLEKMTKDGVNPDNPAAVKAWLAGNRGALIEYGLIKGGTVAAFDTVSAALGGAIVARPAMALANAERNVLRTMGADLADPKAVAAATKSPQFRTAMAPFLAEYQASATTAGNAMRGAAAMASEFAGEFGGEYVGTGVAGGGWNTNEALLEGVMAGGTSAVTTAGEFALAKAVRKPNSPLTNAANAAGGANAQGSSQVPPDSPTGGSPVAPGPQVPADGQGSAPITGQAGSAVPGAIPPVDPLATRNDAEIARFTQEMADAEARSEKLNSRVLEGVPDDRLQNIADEFAFKAQQGIPLTPEQQRVAENVVNELEFRSLKNAEAADQGQAIGGIVQRQQANRDNVTRQADLLDQETEAAAGVPRPAPASGIAIIEQQIRAGVPLDQITASTPAAKARLRQLQRDAAGSQAAPAQPVRSPTGPAKPEAEAPPVPAAATAPDKNGFIAGPDGYRIKIDEHTLGSNFLDPQADAGAITYVVRKGDNDRSPLNMIVAKSGKLVHAGTALGPDQKSNGTAWIPPSPAARDQVVDLLQKRALTEVGSEDRRAIDADVVAAVAGGTGGTPVAEEAIDQQQPSEPAVANKPADSAPTAAALSDADLEAIFDAAAAEVGAAPAAGGIQKGEVGGKMGSGEVVLTASGRRTTPFPQIKSGPRGTATTVKAVDGWLMQNALDEAKSRGDNFNTRQFESNLANPSKADKDSAEEYLFGQQPDVPRPLLKPLVQQQQAPAEPQPGVTLNDVPPKLMRNLKVPVERLVGGEVKTVEVSANEAIADLDEEIAAYEKLLACVKAVA